MADKLKVFKNQVNASASASLAAVPINVLTNNATTQAVVKDVAFKVGHTNPLYEGVYDYPVKVKVGDFTVEEAVKGNGLTLTGSQIIDSSSSFSIEIQPEAQKVDYGILEVMLLSTTGVTNFYRYNLSQIGNPAGKGSAILEAIKSIGVPIVGPGGVTSLQGNTGCTIVRNGETLFAYANGSSLFVVKASGELVVQLSMPTTIYAICADSNFIYGKSNGTDNVIRRWSISTLTAASNLSLNQSTNGFTNSNPGFIDHYNGFIYLRGQGAESTVWVINTSTGSTTTFQSSIANNENLGGFITVNTSGVPFLVEHQDTQVYVRNLNTSAEQTFSTPLGTHPTTTQGNHAAVIANGIVLFNNGSYNQTCIVDVNGATVLRTSTTGLFTMGGLSGVMISKPFQTAPVQVTREIQYSLLASGVESTT
jgi:hypothetical protein